jgi:hypothetical protein
VYTMRSGAILHEVRQLGNVSDRLDLLAERHPLVSEGLITISGNVRHTAALPEVLVATKMRLLSEPSAGLSNYRNCDSTMFAEFATSAPNVTTSRRESGCLPIEE